MCHYNEILSHMLVSNFKNHLSKTIFELNTNIKTPFNNQSEKNKNKYFGRFRKKSIFATQSKELLYKRTEK